MERGGQRRQWLEFQPQFNAGHVLQAAVVVVTMTTAFIMVQERQNQVEKDLQRQEENAKQQQVGMAASVRDLKDDFQRRLDGVTRVLERIDDKLDRKQDRTAQ